MKQFGFSQCIDFESKSHSEVSAAFGALFGGFLADLMGRLGNELVYCILLVLLRSLRSQDHRGYLAAGVV